MADKGKVFSVLSSSNRLSYGKVSVSKANRETNKEKKSPVFNPECLG
jgi:hypothetical protein